MVALFDSRVPESFWERVITEPNSGCWLWLGHRTHDGYGQWRNTVAHRFLYLTVVSDIGNLQLDHLCRTRCCVNPDHLEPVTKAENQKRGLLGDLKTHCKHGHPFNNENTYRYKGKTGTWHRTCRVCNRRIQRERSEKRGAVCP